MAAVVTNQTKFQQAEKLFGDVGRQYTVLNDSDGSETTSGITFLTLTDSANADQAGLSNVTYPAVYRGKVNTYYAAIGRTQDWNDSDAAPSPGVNDREGRKARYDLTGVKKISDYKFVIPRYNWSTGTTYSGYDDNTTGYPTNAYYVLTDENNVYMCLQAAKNNAGTVQPSTIKPTGTATTALDTGDGYRWKFLYSIDATNANKYLAANYMPVEFVTDSALDPTLTAAQQQQKTIQNAAVKGRIINIQLDSGGTGYTSAPSVTIYGDGSSAAATATLSGSSVSKVELGAYDSGGSGYKQVSVAFSGGGSPTKPAKARAVLGAEGGPGADPRKDLKASSVMFNVQPAGNNNGTWVVGNDFRQVAVLKNPLKPGQDSADAYKHESSFFTGADGNAAKAMKVGISTEFVVDGLITGGTSGAKAYLDSCPSGTGDKTLKFHKNETTGFVAFQVGETITGSLGGSGTISTLGDSAGARDVDPMTGDLLYIDNRAAVTRTESQTEDLKIVITL
jgi:hypothetical protein